MLKTKMGNPEHPGSEREARAESGVRLSRAQVEKLLAWSEDENKARFYSASELVKAFPSIARHYLELLEENERMRNELTGTGGIAACMRLNADLLERNERLRRVAETYALAQEAFVVRPRLRG